MCVFSKPAFVQRLTDVVFFKIWRSQQTVAGPNASPDHSQTSQTAKEIHIFSAWPSNSMRRTWSEHGQHPLIDCCGWSRLRWTSSWVLASRQTSCLFSHCRWKRHLPWHLDIWWSHKLNISRSSRADELMFLGRSLAPVWKANILTFSINFASPQKSDWQSLEEELHYPIQAFTTLVAFMQTIDTSMPVNVHHRKHAVCSLWWEISTPPRSIFKLWGGSQLNFGKGSKEIHYVGPGH